MKKFFYMSVMVLMASLALTSCGSDDDKKKDEPQPQGGIKTVVYDASVTFSQEMIDICDVTIFYKDGDGKTATETVKSATWNKKVTVKNLPAVVGVKFDFKLKDGIELTKEKYDLMANLQHYVTIDGVKKGTDQPFTNVGQGTRAEKVADILSRWSERMVYGYAISANGEVTTTENITF